MVVLVSCEPPTGEAVQSPSLVFLQVYLRSVSHERSQLPYPPPLIGSFNLPSRDPNALAQTNIRTHSFIYTVSSTNTRDYRTSSARSRPSKVDFLDFLYCLTLPLRSTSQLLFDPQLIIDGVQDCILPADVIFEPKNLLCRAGIEASEPRDRLLARNDGEATL